MTSYPILDEPSLRMVAAMARKSSQSPSNHARHRRQPRTPTADGIPVYNNSGYSIPAYGVMKPTTMVSGRVTVVQPDSSLVPVYLLNGPTPIAVGANGTALPFGNAKIASSAVTIGDGLGPNAGSFSLVGNMPQIFTIIAGDGALCRGFLSPIAGGYGTLAGTLVASGTATVNVMDATGASTSFTLTASTLLLASTSTLASGAVVRFTRDGSLWKITGTQC